LRGEQNRIYRQAENKMTVNVDENKKRVVGDNVTTLVTFTFKAQLAAELRVFKINTGVTPNTSVELTQGGGADFTVSLNEGEGGSVTFTVPLVTGYDYLIKYDPELTQETGFPTEGNFPEDSVEAALDRLTLIAIKLNEIIDRKVGVPETSALTNLTLNPQANTLVGWNATGDDLENKVAADIDLTVVSAYIATLLDDSTASEARSTLGLGSLAVLSTLPLSSLAAQAANTIVANATNASAVPTAVTVDSSSVVGRGSSGNIANLTAGTGITIGASSISASGTGGKFLGEGINSTASTNAGTVPSDDTIPQSSEGAEIITAAITPDTALDVLIVSYWFSGGSSAGVNLACSLFKDSDADSLQTRGIYGFTSNQLVSLMGEYKMVSGTTSAITFKTRAGCASGNCFFNSPSGTRLYGGNMNSGIRVKKYT